LFIPFGIVSGLLLAAFLTLVFAVEIYVDDVYDGPFKKFVVLSEHGRLLMNRFSLPR